MEGDVGAADFRCSCRAGLENVLFTVVRLELEVCSCRTVLEDVPPVGGADVAGGVFLPGRGAESDGRWVLRDGFPAEPGWGAAGADGAAGVLGASPVFSRLVDRALPGFGEGVETAGPPGWGWRGAVVPVEPLPTAALVWVLLFTVLPPITCEVICVERVD